MYLKPKKGKPRNVTWDIYDQYTVPDTPTFVIFP